MTTRCRLRSDSGYTLIEMMVVVAVIGILGSMAVLQTAAVRPAMEADGAMRAVMGQLNMARETAVAQRRRVTVEWDLANSVLRIVRQDLPTGTTVLTAISFESRIRFLQLAGASDTPDGFGNASAADFDASPVMFDTDGALVDESGAPVNGTFFLMAPDTPVSFRAVTILGATGRVRGYQWMGSTWKRV